MADCEAELVEVRLAGPVSARLNATFLPLAQSSVQDLIKQLLEKDGEQIRREILGPEAESDAGADELGQWAIQQTTPAGELTAERVKQLKRDSQQGKQLSDFVRCAQVCADLRWGVWGRAAAARTWAGRSYPTGKRQTLTQAGIQAISNHHYVQVYSTSL